MRSRIVGIDLGTTHTVVAWASPDSPEDLHVFPIPQLVTASEIEALPLFASCLYAPTPGEVLVDSWNDAPWAAGELARRRGAEIPGRLVASAKSWLCHPAVDRTAPILPWGAGGAEDEVTDIPRISPLDASARFLEHVRRAFDESFPATPLASQDVILTVPASFDEIARELTLQAARRAGLDVRLLEEPQAAFYDFMKRAGAPGLEALLGAKDEALVLVCDVGGGTTDLSLIRVARGRGAQPFEVSRVAVGHHLLLGGDNMDLALAMLCESRMGKLDAARFGQLVSACRTAKERLLSADAPEDVPIAVLGSGAKLVGGALTTRLTRAEAETVVLSGFFPETPRDARPQRTKSALVAFGLPYEKDVAITRHVAWFFARHTPAGAHPDAILLNGGVFRAQKIAERLIVAIEAWGGPKLQVLAHPEPDLGVARGAVAYGLALRGHGVRIGGGSARGYYVGLDAEQDGKRVAMCVVPRGAAEGVPQIAKGRPLALVVGRPVRFDLFATDDARVDAPGALATLDDDDSFQALPPVAVAFGAEDKRGTQAPVRVELEGQLTAVGTVDLACIETGAAPGKEPRKFRLAFQIRAADDARPSRAPSVAPPSIATRRLQEAHAAIDRAFGKGDDATERAAKDLVRELERIHGDRTTWTTELARALYDALIPLRAARRKSEGHERVFWLLAGFCVRPGFGDPLDPKRVSQLVPLFAERVVFPEQTRGWQQFWIAWRRAAGGIEEPTQTQIRDLVDPFLAPPEKGLKRPKKLKPAAHGEMLEMASSLERVPAARRAELGGWLLERTWTDRDPRLWAAVGRLGARVPAYASIHHVVPPLVAERWLDHLLREKWAEVPTAARAAMQLARVTDDRARDVSETVRRAVEKRLVAVGASPDWVTAVREHVPLEEADRAAFFGEGLPVGLSLVDGK